MCRRSMNREILSSICLWKLQENRIKVIKQWTHSPKDLAHRLVSAWLGRCAVRDPPISPLCGDFFCAWIILLSILGPSCFLPWGRFHIEAGRSVKRITPTESMYSITDSILHRCRCSYVSTSIRVLKRRARTSTFYGNLWPHTLKREKHSRICSTGPVD